MATAPPNPAANPAATTALQTGPDHPVMDDDTSHQLAKDAQEHVLFYRDQNIEPWEAAVRGHKLYHQHRVEWRTEAEKTWRSDIRTPDPFVRVEAKAAQMVEIMTGSDPIIQATAVGDDDKEKAKEAEALLDYTIYGNNFRQLFANIARALAITGTDWVTSRWGRRAFTIVQNFTDRDRAHFQAKVGEAVNEKGAPAPPDWQQFPAQFAQWRNDVNLNLRMDIPEPPLDGPREIITFQGPIIERVPYFEMLADPLVQDRRMQPKIIRRMVRPESWVAKLVEKGVFDEQRVANAMEGWDGERLEQYEQQVATLLGYSVGQQADPAYKKAHEVWVVYAQENQEWPYQVILNQKEVVNVRPDQLPYNHGECEYLPLRNVLVPGYLAGVSDLKQTEDTYHEINSLRSLRMDAVKLAVLPAMAKNPESGLTEAQRHIRPGMLVNVRQAQSIRKLIESTVPEVAFREPQELKNDLDEATALPPHVRGQQAQINRVSASEAQGRLQQALLRLKLNAASLEEDMNPIAGHALSHWAQFGDPEIQIRATGRASSKLSTIRKADIPLFLAYDMRFRGATRSLDRDRVVADLTNFLKEFQVNMAPVEIRALMRDIIEATGQKGIDDVVNQKYTNMLQASWEAQKMAEGQALAAQSAQLQAGAGGVPASVDAQTAQGMAGGGQQ